MYPRHAGCRSAPAGRAHREAGNPGRVIGASMRGRSKLEQMCCGTAHTGRGSAHARTHRHAPILKESAPRPAFPVRPPSQPDTSRSRCIAASPVPTALLEESGPGLAHLPAATVRPDPLTDRPPRGWGGQGIEPPQAAWQGPIRAAQVCPQTDRRRGFQRGGRLIWSCGRRGVSKGGMAWHPPFAYEIATLYLVG